MAFRYYMLNTGHQLQSDVTEDSSLSASDFALRVDDDAYDKLNVIKALEVFKAYLVSTETNPLA